MSESIKCFLVQVKNGRWRRPGNKRWNTFKSLPVGAMWFAPWLDDRFKPQLEHVLIVRTPGGDWTIDGEANNCTTPHQPITPGDGRTYTRFQEDHHCWIIHGTPPDITVDKNGVTCQAGGGSILQGSWHGFLRNGHLVVA